MVANATGVASQTPRDPANVFATSVSKGMKALLLLSVVLASTLLTGCRTVAVVEHDRPVYARSRYYHSRPSYYSSRRPDYYRSGYYRSGYDRRYYGSSRYDRDYSRRSYYRTGYRSPRVIIR